MAANSRFFIVACVVSGLPVQCYPQETHDHDRYRQRLSSLRQLRPRDLPIVPTSQDQWLHGQSNLGQQPSERPPPDSAQPTGSIFRNKHVKKWRKTPVRNSPNEFESTTRVTPYNHDHTPTPDDNSQETGVYNVGRILSFKNWSVWIFFLIILAIGISPIIAALLIMKLTRATCYKTLMTKLLGEREVSIELHAPAQTTPSMVPHLHPQLYPGQELSEMCYLIKDVDSDTHGTSIHPESSAQSSQTRIGPGSIPGSISSTSELQLATDRTTELTFNFNTSGHLQQVTECDTGHRGSESP